MTKTLPDYQWINCGSAMYHSHIAPISRYCVIMSERVRILCHHISKSVSQYNCLSGNQVRIESKLAGYQRLILTTRCHNEYCVLYYHIKLRRSCDKIVLMTLNPFLD
jgi:hypothetical protein